MTTYKKKMMNRRLFLKGAAGVTFSLPFLHAVHGRRAMAATADEIEPRYFVCVRAGNGVQQQAGSEPERFWPTAMGALSAGMMTQEVNGDMRSTGILADHADKLLIVSGTKHNFGRNGCGHAGSGAQCLTNAPGLGDRNNQRSAGESVDNYIQRILCPNDPEPLTTIAGRDSGFLDEVLSYNQPLQGENTARLRSAERNPWNIYTSLFGMPGQDSNGMLEDYVGRQRKSINDLMREQLDRINNSSALSQMDKNNIQLHQQAIRDLEIRMVDCHLPEARWMEIQNAANNGDHTDAANHEDMSYMMMDMIALAFACDLKRAATLQIGNGNDQNVYSEVSGFPFHWISHRIQGDGGTGSAPTIDNAADFHYEIDKIQMRYYKYLLDRLAEYSGPNGTLLDSCAAMWVNDLANGVGHSANNLPVIIAGSANGYLRQGQFVDARDTGTPSGDGWVSNGQVLNTICNAVGVGEILGAPVTDFGHKGGNGAEQPPGGEISGMKV